MLYERDDTYTALKHIALWQKNTLLYAYAYPLHVHNCMLYQLPNIPNDVINLELTNVSKLEEIILGDDEDRKLEKIEISHCSQLKRLGPLPLRTKRLVVSNCPLLETIDCFVEGLREIMISDCPRLEELPPLPPQLKILRLSDTGITVIPPRMGNDIDPIMPANTFLVLYPPERFVIPFKLPNILSMKKHIQEWQDWHRNRVAKERAQTRAKAIKRDLVETVFAPERIQKLLDTHGIEILEAL